MKTSVWQFIVGGALLAGAAAVTFWPNDSGTNDGGDNAPITAHGEARDFLEGFCAESAKAWRAAGSKAADFRDGKAATDYLGSQTTAARLEASKAFESTIMRYSGRWDEEQWRVDCERIAAQYDTLHRSFAQ